MVPNLERENNPQTGYASETGHELETGQNPESGHEFDTKTE